MNIAFIGLGTMGYPMAGHLACAGHTVTVYNRTRSKALAWQTTHGGKIADSPAEAAASADIAFTCVGNDNDLRDVTLGPQGIAATLRPDAALIDHSTVSASLSRTLAKLLADTGRHFLDAPVSGGQQGAEQGQLTIMCGGDAAIFARSEPTLRHYARAVTWMGESGSGQLTKMVNQICVAGLVQALAEGLGFAEKAGLDGQKVIDAISQGAASSWQMVNRHKTMLAGDYLHGFAVDWMRKDLALCQEEASNIGASLPVTALVDQLYAEVQAMGGGRWDTSSLLARLQSTPQKP
ncbi:MAG: NAD(P)-dependent oxidoreductase [Moraxellaceae bacterium]|nr:NAD(P)-dependent oxidoreductase [Moraxellaceae bacterium]